MWNFDTAVFTDEDGVEWVSIGLVTFGNNQDYEVVVRKDRKRNDGDFQVDQFEVFMCDHEQDEESKGLPLQDWMSDLIQSQPHHLNTVVIQLGHLLLMY
jgi:hypothetical protein